MNDNPWRNWTWLLLAMAALLPLSLLLAWIATVRTIRSCKGIVPSSKPSSQALQNPVPHRSNDRFADHQPSVRQPYSWWPTTQVILNYGGGKAEVGMVRPTEQEPIGPEAFALARNGNVLVADQVNHRVQVYGLDGVHIRGIELPEVHLNDLTTDDLGRLYVYDQARRTLLQYDESGRLHGTLQLNPADLDTRGYFHVVADSVYFADAAVRDVLVATLQDGVLSPPDNTRPRQTEGIHAGSGRVYSVTVTKGQALRLETRYPAAPATAKSLDVVIRDILAARYAGEDQAGRVYVQDERLVGGKVILEVLTISPEGEPVVATRIPENDYAIWTTKLVDVMRDGTIVQFRPGKQEARLNLFAEKKP